MNYYQSFSHYADGDWGIEFHCQSKDHADFVVRLYWCRLPGWGWLFKPYTRHWRVDNY